MNNGRLFDVVLQFFQEERWRYQILEPKSVIRTGVHGEHGTWICYARVSEEEDRLVFHVLMGMEITPQYRRDVLEYLNRVNFLLPVGNFEMDVETGSVRFRAGMETPGNNISLEAVRRLARRSVEAMDRYYSGILSVVHGGLSPAAALARASTQPVESALDR